MPFDKYLGREFEVKFKFFFEQILILTIIFHTIACAWMRIGIALESSKSWLYEQWNEETFEDDSDIYLASFYWTMTVLTTIGYGDIKGGTVYEYLLSFVIELIGIGVFALFMGKI